MESTYTAIFDKVDEWYIGYVEELPGANTQGRTHGRRVCSYGIAKCDTFKTNVIYMDVLNKNSDYQPLVYPISAKPSHQLSWSHFEMFCAHRPQKRRSNPPIGNLNRF